MRCNRFWSVLVVLALLSACGKKQSGSVAPVVPPPSGGGGGGTLPPPSTHTPENQPGPEKFDVLDTSFENTSGWKMDSSPTGHESVSTSASGLELSLSSPYLSGDPSRCLTASQSLTRTELLKTATEATIELQLKVVSLPKGTEYHLLLEAAVDPGRRLFNFTPRGIRTYTPEASKKVSDALLTPGDHTARLVARGDITTLYLDGKNLGSVKKGYMDGGDGGNSGNLLIEFALPEKFPAVGPQDCPSTPAKVVLKKLRVASKAYMP